MKKIKKLLDLQVIKFASTVTPAAKKTTILLSCF